MHQTTLSVCCTRGFSGSAHFLCKQNIQRRWQRMTERYLLRTANIISGTGKNKNKLKKESFSHVIEFTRSSGSAQNAGCQRRACQLSIVFYDYITSLLSSGEVCAELNNFGFEVVTVKVVSDMSSINVSWAATGGSMDEIITTLLPRCASELRSKLMDLRVMGNLPPIRFVKDVTGSRLLEVEELLKKADMGPDFEATNISVSSKVQPSLIAERFRQLTVRRHQVKLNRLEEFSCKQGPGGNFEVISSYETLHDGDPTSFVDSKLLVVKTLKEEHLHDDSASLSVHSIDNLKQEYNVDQLEYSFVAAADSIAAAPISSFDLEINCTPGSVDKFRGNINGLDHSTLYQQVLQAKRRAEDRSYSKQPDRQGKLGDELPQNGSTKTQRSVCSLTFAYQSKAKTEPLRRDINRLLSSQCQEDGNK